MAELLRVGLRSLVRVMGSIERHQQKERVAAVVTRDQLARLLRQQLRRVAGLDHRTPVPVPVQDRVRSLPAAEVPVGVDELVVEAVMVLESALQRKALRAPVPQLPLADQPGRVACVPQGLGHRPLVKGQPAIPPEIRVSRQSRLPGVPTGEERAAARRTHRLGVELREPHPFVGDPVHMRCRHFRPAVETRLSPAHVVGKEHNYVGPRGRVRGSEPVLHGDRSRGRRPEDIAGSRDQRSRHRAVRLHETVCDGGHAQRRARLALGERHCGRGRAGQRRAALRYVHCHRQRLRRLRVQRHRECCRLALGDGSGACRDLRHRQGRPDQCHRVGLRRCPVLGRDRDRDLVNPLL